MLILRQEYEVGFYDKCLSKFFFFFFALRYFMFSNEWEILELHRWRYNIRKENSRRVGKDMTIKYCEGRSLVIYCSWRAVKEAVNATDEFKKYLRTSQIRL